MAVYIDSTSTANSQHPVTKNALSNTGYLGCVDKTCLSSTANQAQKLNSCC